MLHLSLKLSINRPLLRTHPHRSMSRYTAINQTNGSKKGVKKNCSDLPALLWTEELFDCPAELKHHFMPYWILYLATYRVHQKKC